ncbi:MAG: (d)CMP kinase, partial [Rickettsiales bacterium]|nr:(d)CMP kinase [Rickettsiales bacterium]
MIKKPLIIAVDGPSSSGKGTLAEKIANHFNLAYLNSGALFRAVAMQIIKSQIELEKLNLHLKKLVNNLYNYNLQNPQLFSEDVGLIASQIAKNQTLRDSLLKFQRDF